MYNDYKLYHVHICLTNFLNSNKYPHGYIKLVECLAFIHYYHVYYKNIFLFQQLLNLEVLITFFIVLDFFLLFCMYSEEEQPCKRNFYFPFTGNCEVTNVNKMNSICSYLCFLLFILNIYPKTKHFFIDAKFTQTKQQCH